ncbi:MULTISPECIES: DUF4870 domain-containing protein [Mammaliicoccus]|uniref:DUF4870 domain-containing protein n=3 Tax=Mammaliicoccus sciuri TaxID=1296 RepID=A0AB37HWW7_MAMSC|nr:MULTISPECIES: DUF4870 domain-containing protein [Mammaliicoccus]ARB40073.1 hypothetical protein B5728_04315 [Mammaliicoccus sciuri]MCD8798009.1 DUF4870 domain-containing protein [Mammaliicoccus sciuri]MCD8818043.1 DUF4870 domain-containing protein [Mammaliicoccus sciuri]MCE4979312.1 DUF4870 domain-containing protein [Mammaliicoccus sciuri]MCE5039775.1 DUF4870 domain-containing protein [Mammaliicoccus sciuri]
MSENEQNPFQQTTTHSTYEDVSQHLDTTDDDRLFGMLIYLTSFFASFFAPLIIWLIKRENSPFVDRIGKDYLNFFISYTIWGIVGTLLCLVLVGFIILPILAILAFIFTVIGAIKAYNGETYLPPLSIRMIK